MNDPAYGPDAQEALASVQGPHAMTQLTQMQLARLVRLHVGRELYDESATAAPHGVAVYSLSDPGDLRVLRYIGQSSAPRRRFFQHLNAARLWLQDERPWWIKDPKLRPLYSWVRTLYRERARLPTMVIWEWAETVTLARIAERNRIFDMLSQGLPLLNVEAERRAPQLQLF